MIQPIPNQNLLSLFGISVLGADALDNQITNFIVGHVGMREVRAPGLDLRP